MAESGRSTLSFVRTSILKSADGGNTFNEEEAVERRVEGGGGDEQISLLQRDKELLASRGDEGSLYEKLKANKEAADAEWKEKHNMFLPPKAMDEEEYKFLSEQTAMRRASQAKRAEQDERDVAGFAAARARQTFKQPTLPIRFDDGKESVEDPGTKPVITVKKRRSKGVEKRRVAKRGKTVSSTQPPKGLVDYDSDG